MSSSIVAFRTAGIRHSRPAAVAEGTKSNSASDINFAARFSVGASITTRDSDAVVVQSSIEHPNLNPNDQLESRIFFGAVTVMTVVAGSDAKSVTDERATVLARPDLS